MTAPTGLPPRLRRVLVAVASQGEVVYTAPGVALAVRLAVVVVRLDGDPRLRRLAPDLVTELGADGEYRVVEVPPALVTEDPPSAWRAFGTDEGTGT